MTKALLLSAMGVLLITTNAMAADVTSAKNFDTIQAQITQQQQQTQAQIKQLQANLQQELNTLNTQLQTQVTKVQTQLQGQIQNLQQQINKLGQEQTKAK